ncbi:hypothetical protein CEXT_90331 [Caerostris extrusa]|uniref:Uncharacterized protein n=1 Tax=Caerostris extrusa TaxID=172846 RepID=A0AAV4NSN2_CAEEX|nr:hypothetical protein CEXT_90331 [Caerostris extrusa]
MTLRMYWRNSFRTHPEFSLVPPGHLVTDGMSLVSFHGIWKMHCRKDSMSCNMTLNVGGIPFALPSRVFMSPPGHLVTDGYLENALPKGLDGMQYDTENVLEEFLSHCHPEIFMSPPGHLVTDGMPQVSSHVTLNLISYQQNA